MCYHRSEFIYFASLAQKACRWISGTPEQEIWQTIFKHTLQNLLSKNVISYFFAREVLFVDSLLYSLPLLWSGMVMTLGTGLLAGLLSSHNLTLQSKTNPQATEWEEQEREQLFFVLYGKPDEWKFVWKYYRTASFSWDRCEASVLGKTEKTGRAWH